jgi:hypothetical protein
MMPRKHWIWVVFLCLSTVYGQVVPSTDTLTVQENQTTSWWHKLKWGANITYYPGHYFSYAIGPQVAYVVNQRIRVSGGIFYKQGFKSFPNHIHHDFGARAQVSYRIWYGLTGLVEYEWVRYLKEGDLFREDSHAISFGGGYLFRRKKAQQIGLFLHYNILNSAQDIPYPGAFMLRCNLWF